MKVAVIFHRLGPYHLARLRAAGGSLSVVAIETSGVDETYAWDVINESDGFERKTLFQHADAQKQPPDKVVQGMMEALDEISPQVVAIPGWSDTAALGALLWCVRHQVPVVLMSESTEWDEVRKAWREFPKRRIVSLCSAALVGGQSHEDYIAKLGMPREHIFMGYDAVDNDYFIAQVREMKQRAEETRKNYRLPKRYFLASSRFIEKKNLPRLLDAYAKYRLSYSSPAGEESEPWHLVLLGDGELLPVVLETRSSLGLEEFVHLPGFIQYPDLPAYYAFAGAFIHASTTEQWGLVVNEAMASGLPVLVSHRCGCAQDLVQEGVNGFTFDPYDVEQITQLMLQISDPAFSSSDFGNASCKIIAEWGTRRFALGLEAAIECGMKVGSKSPNLRDRMLLSLLLRR